MADVMDIWFLALVLGGFGGRISFANNLITEDDYYQSKLLKECLQFLCLPSRVFAFGLTTRSVIAFIVYNEYQPQFTEACYHWKMIVLQFVNGILLLCARTER